MVEKQHKQSIKNPTNAIGNPNVSTARCSPALQYI